MKRMSCLVLLLICGIAALGAWAMARTQTFHRQQDAAVKDALAVQARDRMPADYFSSLIRSADEAVK